MSDIDNAILAFVADLIDEFEKRHATAGLSDFSKQVFKQALKAALAKRPNESQY